jgi:hypothetical protein
MKPRLRMFDRISGGGRSLSYPKTVLISSSKPIALISGI